jgi:hypothetical protein
MLLETRNTSAGCSHPLGFTSRICPGRGSSVLAVDQSWVELAALDRRRHEEGLERRARLHRIEEGAGSRGGVGHLAKAVGVEARGLGERQHVAVLRVDRHDDAAARAGRADRLGEAGGRIGLHRGVEGEHDVTAGGAPGRLSLRDEEVSGTIALDRKSPALAAQPAVFLLLDAAHAAPSMFAADQRRASPPGIGAPRPCRMPADSERPIQPARETQRPGSGTNGGREPSATSPLRTQDGGELRGGGVGSLISRGARRPGGA